MFVALLAIACNTPKNDKINVGSEASVKTDFNVALKFINDYVAYCNHGESKDTAWIDHQTLLTEHFKTAYHQLLDAAQKADPELGLDFDPIFDAQDYDDKGFVIQKVDSASGYVSVVGKTWKDFTIVLKVVNQENKSMVDGVGVINIPDERRAKR